MRVTQTTLNGGEISPHMYARVDFGRYATSLATCLNYVPRPEGGVENRGGLNFVAEVKDSSASTRIIPFEFNSSQTYILELGNLYMRFHTNGGQILDSATTGTVSGATQANPVVITDTGHPYSDGDEIYIASVGGMTELNGRNFLVANSTANTYELTDLQGTNVDGTSYTAYTSGGTSTKVYEITTPWATADLFDLRFAQVADTMTIVHPGYSPRELVRVDNDTWTLTEISFLPQQAAPTALSVTVNTAGTTTYRYLVTAVARDGAEESYPAVQAATGTISGATQANPVVVTDTGHPYSDGDEVLISGVGGMTEINDRRYIVTNSAANTYELYTLSGNSVDGTGYTAFSTNGSSYAAYYEITNGATTSDNTITWTAAAGAESYSVYRQKAGVYGFIGSTTTTSFTDDNLAPDTGDSPSVIFDPFELGTNYYPATVGFYNQRRIFANSNTYPQRFWMSQVGVYSNFGKSSPTRDDDAIIATLASRKVNRIEHVVGVGGLLMLTSGGEWLITAPDDNITPSTVQAKDQSFYGSESLPPLTAGDVALFLQPGQIVRDLLYEFSIDKYKGSDITILARHLFDNNTMVDWTYAQTPRSTVWAARDDGIFLSLTYLRDQEVYGWARHITKGEVESTAAVREGNYDVPYFVVKRTINGVTKRYIERMWDRAFTEVEDCRFLDSHLVLDTPVTISGYTNANPVVVTATGHPFANDDVVDISNVYVTSTDTATQGKAFPTEEINANGYVVKNKTANTFELYEADGTTTVDGTAWGTYHSGGEAREAVTTVSGLWHLEGETVSIFGNGYVETGLTVSDGAVTLSEAASRVCVGIPYTSRLETLPLYMNTRNGSTQGLKKNAHGVSINVVDTLGMWFGPDVDTMREYIFPQPTLYGQTTQGVTGEISVTLKPDWKKVYQFVLENRDPVPCTITSISPDAAVGG